MGRHGERSVQGQVERSERQSGGEGRITSAHSDRHREDQVRPEIETSKENFRGEPCAALSQRDRHGKGEAWAEVQAAEEELELERFVTGSRNYELIKELRIAYYGVRRASKDGI